MDPTYMEIGTEVIIWKPRFTEKTRCKWHCGKIISLTRTFQGEPACYIAGENVYVWLPEELMLASDKVLLRPEEIP